MKCPVCGKTEFDEYSSFDICPFCKWEDDGLQGNDHNYAGGANHLSVNEARIEYFLLNFSTTKKKAKELHDDYSKVLVTQSNNCFTFSHYVNRQCSIHRYFIHFKYTICMQFADFLIFY